ncbi:hypothetical protein DPMN_071564 [Dreissena polymorpha]|uniref:Uncharacterized protein n=1 Tax=Dreissena polymorpha TaxID=45954 RepID=A0A9D4BXD5_DREPO|nr:hypothetical protein DPMN_071564 [Dreissena polymorpha]
MNMHSYLISDYTAALNDGGGAWASSVGSTAANNGVGYSVQELSYKQTHVDTILQVIVCKCSLTSKHMWIQLCRL